VDKIKDFGKCNKRNNIKKLCDTFVDVVGQI
jgi:hypothetical protein